MKGRGKFPFVSSLIVVLRFPPAYVYVFMRKLTCLQMYARTYAHNTHAVTLHTLLLVFQRENLQHGSAD